MTELKLELVDYTYAETADGEIRIHKELFDYEPRLYWHALEHELGHQGKTVWEDFMWDLKDLTNLKLHFLALGFYLKYPRLILRMIAPVHIRTLKREENINAMNATESIDKIFFPKRIIEVNFVLIIFYFFYLLLMLGAFSLL